MSTTRQALAVTLANLRSMSQRLGASVVIVVGIAGVVAVLISVLAMARALKGTIANSASPDRVIVLSRGAESETASTLSRSAVLSILDAPGIDRAAGGQRLAVAELMTQARVQRLSGDGNAFVTIRATGADVLAVRPEMHIVAGRMFRPGLRELVVGKAAKSQFRGLGLGERVLLRDGDWRVVGIFTSNGNSHESEILADAETVLSAYQYNEFLSVTARVKSPADYDTLAKFLRRDPKLKVDIHREPEYFASVARPMNSMLETVAYLIGGVMATGALAGALNTMYSAVSARAKEIATLRAIGFGGGTVLISIFAEALLLAALGAGIGVSLAYLLFNGNAISMMSSEGTNSQLVFSLSITPGLAITGFALGCFIGFLGGLFPAIQVARRPVAVALRGS